MLKVLDIVVIMIFIAACGGNEFVKERSNASLESEGKPDLIIESIDYEALEFEGMTLTSGMNFILRIKNMGVKDFVERFYISNTRTDRDLAMNWYPHSHRVNDNRARIAPGGVIEVHVQAKVSSKRIRFLIDTEGQQRKSMRFTRIEELDYDNNDYILFIGK